MAVTNWLSHVLYDRFPLLQHLVRMKHCSSFCQFRISGGNGRSCGLLPARYEVICCVGKCRVPAAQRSMFIMLSCGIAETVGKSSFCCLTLKYNNCDSAESSLTNCDTWDVPVEHRHISFDMSITIPWLTTSSSIRSIRGNVLLFIINETVLYKQ